MELILSGADAVRRGVWRQLTRTSLGRTCATSRNARLTALAITHLTVSGTLALVAPLWLLLLGPIILGVPHVFADVRFFITRQRLAWWRLGLILAPIALLVGYRGAELFGIHRPLWTDVGFGSAAVVMGALTSRTPIMARVTRTLMAIGFAIVAVTHANTTALIFAHAHNVIALGFFLLWASRGRLGTAQLTAVIGFFSVAALLYSGWLEPVALAAGAYHPGVTGLTIDTIAAGLAPGMPPEVALHLVVVYAFAQAMHYAIWLRLTPGAAGQGPAAPTFKRTVATWRTELGGPLFWVGVVSCLALPLWAAFGHPHLVRDQYLALAGFHGWLELAVLTHVGWRALPAPFARAPTSP